MVHTCRQLRHPGHAGDSSPGLEGLGLGGSILVSGKVIAASGGLNVKSPVSAGYVSIAIPAPSHYKTD